MPPRIGLIPVVRVVATHRSVTAAVEAMLSVRRIGVAEESVGIQEDGRDAWMVIINGETESRSRIDKAAGFLRGWCEAKRIEAEILLPPAPGWFSAAPWPRSPARSSLPPPPPAW